MKKTKTIELYLFVGDWKKLKPLGYKFQKLYAANYICYHKGNEYSTEEIWIWKKGKDIQCSTLNALETSFLIKYLMDKNFILEDKYPRFAFNTKTETLEEYDFRKHEIIGKYGLNVSDEEIKRHNNEYRIFGCSQEIIEMIKELIQNELITLTTIEIELK